MNFPLLPSTLIEILCPRLQKAQDFSANPALSYNITDIILVRSGYANIFNTGLFNVSCYEWRKISHVV